MSNLNNDNFTYRRMCKIKMLWNFLSFFTVSIFAINLYLSIVLEIFQSLKNSSHYYFPNILILKKKVVSLIFNELCKIVWKVVHTHTKRTNVY
jgi:hypothetical protein